MLRSFGDNEYFLEDDKLRIGVSMEHIDGDTSKPHTYIFQNVQERPKTH